MAGKRFVVCALLAGAAATAVPRLGPAQTIDELATQVAVREEVMGAIKSGELFDVTEAEFQDWIRRNARDYVEVNERDLPRTFQAVVEKKYQELLQNKANQLDPDGTLKLHAWLKGQTAAMAPVSRQIRTGVELRLRDRRAELDQLFQGAQREVAEVQLAPVMTQLHKEPKDLSEEGAFPSAEEIDAAARDADSRAKLVSRVHEPLRRWAVEKHQALIGETTRQINQLAEGIVKDGIAQRDEQFRTLDLPPRRQTPAGIERELLARLREVVHERRKEVRDDNELPRKIYSEFESAKKAAGRRAEKSLDDRIVKEMNAQQASGKQSPFLSATGPQVREAILAEPAAHRQREKSFTIFHADHMAQLEENAQVALGDAVQKTVEQDVTSRGSKDTRADLASVRGAALKRLSQRPPELAGDWERYARNLKFQFEQIIDEQRKAVADVQVREYSTPLYDKAWIPNEDDITQHARARIDEPWLRNREDLWDRPVQDAQLLEESWKLLSQLAQESLAQGNEAFTKQLALVESVGSEFKEKLQSGASALEKPVEALREAVLNAWQSGQYGILNDRYQELFRAADERIKGLVANPDSQPKFPDVPPGDDDPPPPTAAKESEERTALQIARERQLELVDLYPTTPDCQTSLFDKWTANPPKTEGDLAPYIERYKNWVRDSWLKSSLAAELGVNDLVDGVPATIVGKVHELLDKQKVPKPPLDPAADAQKSSNGKAGDGGAVGAGGGSGDGGGGDGDGDGSGGGGGGGGGGVGGGGGQGSWLITLLLILAALACAIFVYFYVKYVRPRLQLLRSLGEFGSIEEQRRLLQILSKLKGVHGKNLLAWLDGQSTSVPERSPFTEPGDAA